MSRGVNSLLIAFVDVVGILSILSEIIPILFRDNATTTTRSTLEIYILVVTNVHIIESSYTPYTNHWSSDSIMVIVIS